MKSQTCHIHFNWPPESAAVSHERDACPQLSLSPANFFVLSDEFLRAFSCSLNCFESAILEREAPCPAMISDRHCVHQLSTKGWQATISTDPICHKPLYMFIMGKLSF